jgi:hypothetical protein
VGEELGEREKGGALSSPKFSLLPPGWLTAMASAVNCTAGFAVPARHSDCLLPYSHY